VRGCEACRGDLCVSGRGSGDWGTDGRRGGEEVRQVSRCRRKGRERAIVAPPGCVTGPTSPRLALPGPGNLVNWCDAEGIRSELRLRSILEREIIGGEVVWGGQRTAGDSSEEATSRSMRAIFSGSREG